MLLARLFICIWVDNWKTVKGAGFLVNWKRSVFPNMFPLVMDIHRKVSGGMENWL